MDKAQKQLVDTYLRKRHIAAQQGYESDTNDYEYTEYEFNYLYETNPKYVEKLDYNRLGHKVLAMMMVKDPEYIGEFHQQGLLHNLTGDDLSLMFVKRPELVKYVHLHELMYKLESHNVLAILLERPELARWVSHRLNLLDRMDFMYLISRHPEFIDLKGEDNQKAFDENKFTRPDIAYILERQPQLIDRLDYEKLIDSYWLNDLLKAQPQLAPYFKTQGNG